MMTVSVKTYIATAKDILNFMRGSLYIGRYVLAACIRNRRFPMAWMKWRVETYYAIPSSEFTFRKLFKVAKLKHWYHYAKWVQENRKYLSSGAL